MIEWIKAARLRTLPLSLSGIILGSLIAKWKLNSVGESWDVWVFCTGFSGDTFVSGAI